VRSFSVLSAGKEKKRIIINGIITVFGYYTMKRPVGEEQKHGFPQYPGHAGKRKLLNQEIDEKTA